MKTELKKKSLDIQQLEKEYKDKMLDAANQINAGKHKLAVVT